MKTWTCKIGEIAEEKLPPGADTPMRQAVEAAYEALTGEKCQFTFSGWGGELDEGERAVHEDREPDYFKTKWLEERLHELRQHFRLDEGLPNWTYEQWVTMPMVKLGEAAYYLHSGVEGAHEVTDRDRKMGIENLMAVAAACLDAVEAIEGAPPAAGGTKEESPEGRLDRLEERMDDMAEATQADIDALTSELGAVETSLSSVSTDLDSSTKALQTEIDNLKQANPSVDVTALKAAADALAPHVATVDAAAQKIGGLTPTPPAPGPGPSPGPTSTRPVYYTDGDPSTVDTAAWPSANEHTNDPSISPAKPLFFFAQDTQQADGTWTMMGDLQGNGAWHHYTGPTQTP